MRIGMNRAAEGFLFGGPLAGLGEVEHAPQPFLDARSVGADPPEVVMLSVAAWIAAPDLYEPLPWPIVSSRGAGPVLAARSALGLDQLSGRRTATPGASMTESLIAMTLLPSYYDVSMEEGSIGAAVASGVVEAGILWDHAQVDPALGLTALEDLGARFAKYQSGLPLPLRVVAVRADVGAEPRAMVAEGLREAMMALESDRGGVVRACAAAVGAEPAVVDAYFARTIDAGARLDAPEYQAALEVLREYNDADYYAANGRF